MALHLNDWALFCEEGFRLVAEYEVFEKDKRKLNIRCYSNGTQYLVRHWFTGRIAWDDIYTDKLLANKKVFDLLHTYKYHKRLA